MSREAWPRWVAASIAKELSATAAALGLPVLIDQFVDRTAAFAQAADKAEIRITGPYVSRLSHEYWRVEVDVSTLLSCRLGGNRDAYRIHTYAGAFQESMSSPIVVRNYGAEEGDYVAGQPDTLVHLGCLVPSRTVAVRVVNFGQVHPVDVVKQIEINGKYRMEVEAS